jgi:hypothetical protein
MTTKLLLIAALAAFTIIAAFAQNSVATCNNASIPVCGMGAPQSRVQVKPQAVPTSTTAIATVDAYLRMITISNPTAGAITFTLADRQGSPISALGAVSIGANTTYIVIWAKEEDEMGYWCPNGFTLTSSGSGLTWYGAWRQ